MLWTSFLLGLRYEKDFSLISSDWSIGYLGMKDGKVR